NPKIPVDAAGITHIDATREHEARPKLREWAKWLETGAPKNTQEHEIEIGSFKSSEHERFTERVRDSLATARRVVMMGSGLALLGRPVVVETLMRHAKNGRAKVEVYMANPFSPAVEMRLIEEEQGSIKPPDGKRGLLDRLFTLVHYWDEIGRPESV